MTTIDVTNTSPVYNSYNANRVRSMFNVTDEQGAIFTVRAELLLDEIPDWQVGLVVGPSGSGKTTIGKALFDGAAFYEPGDWPADAPIIDTVAPDADFDTVTGALSAVGLGDVPAWLRPYPVLSTGEKFRADLARIVATRPDRVVVDEFTSVVDRQIAKVGAGAFAKSWRRGEGRAVMLSCHYDIADWLEPDWVYDTATATFDVTKGRLRRPSIDVDVVSVTKPAWEIFKPHHYLDSGPMPFSVAYAALVGGEPVAHLGVSSKALRTRSGRRIEARACRMVVMPEWQGAGVGMKFLNHVCEMYLTTGGHLNRPCTTQFHTIHPGLVAALRRDRRWRQISAATAGGSRAASLSSLRNSGSLPGTSRGGFGGHLRPVQGFRYCGEPA